MHGPLGERVEAEFAVRDDLAIVEMARASGLQLLQESERDPMRVDTYGTGELIRAALDAGARRIIVGLGGSATNDAGTGAMRALGVRFYGSGDAELREGMLAYADLQRIDVSALDERLARVSIDLALDVDSPLCGTNGAARTFAAQKGANNEQIDQLDAILARIAQVTSRTIGEDARDDPGAGAAGGLGFALIAFLHARAQRGSTLIAREIGLDHALNGAALCITGEGKIDAQTLHGKVVAGVAELARAANVPVLALGGRVEADAGQALRKRGIRAVQIAPPQMQQEAAMREAGALLEGAAERCVREAAPG